MPVKLSEDELNELRESFRHSLNYESEDPTDPIDPLTYRQPDGDSCLHIAAHRGDLRSAELLLKAGLDVDQAGDMGCTPLHYAKQMGHGEVVALLLDYGASTNIRNRFGKLPLEM